MIEDDEPESDIGNSKIHSIQNGLLLLQTVHSCFDKYMIAINPDVRVLTSIYKMILIFNRIITKSPVLLKTFGLWWSAHGPPRLSPTISAPSSSPQRPLSPSCIVQYESSGSWIWLGWRLHAWYRSYRRNLAIWERKIEIRACYGWETQPSPCLVCN